MRKIKAVIFDMDGVLVDSEPVINAAAIAGLKEYGVNAKPEDFVPFIGAGEDKYIGGVAEKYGVPYKFEMKKRVYEIYLDMVEQHLKVYDGIQELLCNLKKDGYKLAVASSADAIKVEANLKAADISLSHFSAIICGNDVDNKKPAPDIYWKAAEKIREHPSNCIVIEDALNGIKAAKAAGMQCIAVASSFKKELLERSEADMVFEKIDEVYSGIRGIG